MKPMLNTIRFTARKTKPLAESPKAFGNAFTCINKQMVCLFDFTLSSIWDVIFFSKRKAGLLKMIKMDSLLSVVIILMLAVVSSSASNAQKIYGVKGISKLNLFDY